MTKHRHALQVQKRRIGGDHHVQATHGGDDGERPTPVAVNGLG